MFQMKEQDKIPEGKTPEEMSGSKQFIWEWGGGN